MVERADIAIIGGGAAGLATAIFAAQHSGGAHRIVILDSAKTLGAKILVSGGGRCNVTHDEISPVDFNGVRTVIKNILAGFGVGKTIEWFASMGVELKREETGKLFPVSDSARTVVNAMLRRCDQLGVIIQPQSRVVQIRPPGENNVDFTIEFSGGVMRAGRVVLSTGGRSLPRSGSDGSGWDLARQLGHSVTPTCAALAPLVLDKRMFHATVAGIAQQVQLTTFARNKVIDRRRGDLLWTHFGISGPVVMDASRHWIIAQTSDPSVRMEINLLPDESLESLDQWLVEQATQKPRASIVTTLSNRLVERVARAVVAHTGLDSGITNAQLPRVSRRKLASTVTGLVLPVLDHRGWNYAEVTAGGVPLDEIDYRTMESKKIPRLFLAGEILDCDGRIGGFNFQWAWATGYLTGRALARLCSGGSPVDQHVVDDQDNNRANGGNDNATDQTGTVNTE